MTPANHHKFKPIIDYHGVNLLLEKISQDHAGKLHELMKDVDVTRFLLVKTADSIESMEQRIKLAVYRWESHLEFRYTVFLKTVSPIFKQLERQSGVQRDKWITDKGLVCGTVGLWEVARQHGSAEIGIWLGKPFWNTGINYEAVRLLLKIAFDHLGLHRIEANIFPENERSIKMFEKLGFVREGILRDKVYKGNEHHDLLVYSILDTEFRHDESTTGCTQMDKDKIGRKELPPKQHEVDEILRWGEDHPGITDKQPKVNHEDWQLEITGLVENPKTYTWEEFNEIPMIKSTSDFHCVETWSVRDQIWDGVPVVEIMEIVQPKAEAKYVWIECGDGYTTSLSIADLIEEENLLAVKLNGELLDRGTGGPLRLVVPQKYAYKSAMYIEKIVFTDTKELGYWEKRGYSDTADVWENDRYSKEKKKRMGGT